LIFEEQPFVEDLERFLDRTGRDVLAWLADGLLTGLWFVFGLRFIRTRKFLSRACDRAGDVVVTLSCQR
jgi:hypothetical protein